MEIFTSCVSANFHFVVEKQREVSLSVRLSLYTDLVHACPSKTSISLKSQFTVQAMRRRQTQPSATQLKRELAWNGTGVWRWQLHGIKGEWISCLRMEECNTKIQLISYKKNSTRFLGRRAKTSGEQAGGQLRGRLSDPGARHSQTVL